MTTISDIDSIKSTLYRGDPFDPQISDLIVQEGRLPVGKSVPDGWTVLDGNMHDSLVVRIVMRYKAEEDNHAV